MRDLLKQWLVSLCLPSLLLASYLANAELLLAVQPNAPQADNIELYQAFADELSEVMGEKVTYTYEKSWSMFRRHLVANDYHLLIAEPHVAAIMSLNLGNGGLDFSPSVGVTDQINYVVVALVDNEELNKMTDLNGKRVCTPLSPGLAAVVFLNQFKDDPVNPPLVVESTRGTEYSYKLLKRQRCEAMVLTKRELALLKTTVSSEFKVLFESKPYPSWSINVTPVIPDVTRKEMQDFLIGMEAESVKKMHENLSEKQEGFVAKEKNAFLDYNILPGVVWGW